MDQPSHTNVDGGATNGGDTFAWSYGLTLFNQPVPLASVPPSSAGAPFLPIPASQGGAVAYQATILPPLSNQQPFHAIGTEGGMSGETPSAYVLTPYNDQPAALASVPPSSSAGTAFLPLPVSQGGAGGHQAAAILPPLSNPHLITLQQLQQQHGQQQQQHQHEQLQAFWVGQLVEAEQATELKVHSLPLARIKKIMKADQDVKMIAAEVPVVFAKACEMFILELTLRAWLHTEGTKRRTLQRSDVAAAITGNEMFDFLMDVVPEELNGAGVLPPPQTAAMPVHVPPMQVSSAGMPVHVPPMHVPFPMYGNEQSMKFMWPIPEYQQQQQNSDGGQDE